jgi:hypothetical protein
MEMLYEGQRVTVIEQRKLSSTILLDGEIVNVANPNLKPILPTRREVFVVKNNGDRISLGEVKKEQIDFVLSVATEWTTVDTFVKKVTQQFSEYRMEDGAPLNQGGFDPMFVVSHRNPGVLVRTGLLIFRPAPQGSGSQWEFKSRTAATQQEISEAGNYAAGRGKFVYQEEQEALLCS